MSQLVPVEEDFDGFWEELEINAKVTMHESKKTWFESNQSGRT